jgi:NDP-sugar pyrophosphorylase family protein
VCGHDEPAGVYAFSRETLDLVPRIGYFDLKEQFLPAMSKAEQRVMTARLGDSVHRIRDLSSYLNAVKQSMMIESGQQAATRIAPRASVSGSAVLDGVCVVEHGAVVEDGAVVHDSVILWGATVGGGSVVSGSVIGPLAAVEPRTRVIRSLITRSMPQSVPMLAEAGRASSGGRATW